MTLFVGLPVATTLDGQNGGGDVRLAYKLANCLIPNGALQGKHIGGRGPMVLHGRGDTVPQSKGAWLPSPDLLDTGVLSTAHIWVFPVCGH